MYSEKLEKLIEMSLLDGVLTEKEKSVLFKKAEAEGIDLDEFEIYLDARLYEKTTPPKDPPPKPLTEEELNQLVDSTIANGILSDSDRQMLMQKAEQTGIDIDEFEIVLDAKLYTIQQEKENVIDYTPD